MPPAAEQRYTTRRATARVAQIHPPAFHARPASREGRYGRRWQAKAQAPASAPSLQDMIRDRGCVGVNVERQRQTPSDSAREVAPVSVAIGPARRYQCPFAAWLIVGGGRPACRLAFIHDEEYNTAVCRIRRTPRHVTSEHECMMPVESVGVVPAGPRFTNYFDVQTHTSYSSTPILSDFFSTRRWGGAARRV